MNVLNYNLIPKETALLVIDMQNGYCSYDGSISKTGADVSLMNDAIAKVKNLVEVCRENGILDIWTIQNHYEDDVTRERHRITPHNRRGKSVPKGLAIKGTWDAEIVDELKDLCVKPAEIILKHRFSAFLDTRLETLLRMRGINTLIVCGVLTTHCVESTVRDGYQRDFDIVVVSDAVGALTEESNKASLNLMNQFFGAVLPAQDAVELISGKKLQLQL